MSENDSFVSEIAQYVFSVVVLPALIAAIIALPFAVKPLRSRHRWVEAGIALALMTAFAVSFARELGANALLRQIVTIPDDNAPFERWHRVGMTAVVLGLAALVIPWLQGTTTLARLVRGVCLAVLSAVVVSLVVRFPGSNAGWQLVQALFICFAILSFTLMGRGAILWAAWLWFGLLGFLVAESGFAQLAVMCGAVSAASFIVAVIWWIAGLFGSRSERERMKEEAADFKRPEELPTTGAIAIALGTMVGVVAMCGKAYDSARLWDYQWQLVIFLPAFAWFGAVKMRRWFKWKRGYAPLVVACILLAAAGIAGYLKWRQSASRDTAPSTDRESLDMYGGRGADAVPMAIASAPRAGGRPEVRW